MWFLLSLWSGKESQWSKWESSFSTLRIIRETWRRDIFYLWLCQTEHDINIIIIKKKQKNETKTRWTADWEPGGAVKTPSAWWRNIGTSLLLMLQTLTTSHRSRTSTVLWLMLPHLPCRRRVRQSPHSPVKQTGTERQHLKKIKAVRSPDLLQFPLKKRHRTNSKPYCCDTNSVPSQVPKV